MADDMRDGMGGDASGQLAVPSLKRDELGFVTSAQPNLSAPQVKFILAAGVTGSVQAAADMIGVAMDEVAGWLDDGDFVTYYHAFLSNKREGIKQIGTQLLPLMMLQLTQVLTSGNNKEILTASKLLSQMQGLLISQNNVIDKGALEAIREELMRPRPAQSYRTVAPKDRAEPT